MKNAVKKASAALIAMFGLLTLFLSASILLDLFGIRAREGNYVLIVVLANFISSILYLTASYGFFTSARWTARLLGTSVLILVIAFSVLFIHIYSGGLYETKTIGAMSFRIAVTFLFSAIAYFVINKQQAVSK